MICTATFNVWKKAHPEFLEATQIAHGIFEAWYLDRAIERCEGSNPLGSDKMITFMLSSVYGYREKTDQTISADVNTKTEIKLNFGDR